jgi:hypothetical protein
VLQECIKTFDSRCLLPLQSPQQLFTLNVAEPMTLKETVQPLS